MHDAPGYYYFKKSQLTSGKDKDIFLNVAFSVPMTETENRTTRVSNFRR